MSALHSLQTAAGESLLRPGEPIAGTQYQFIRELGRGVQGLAIEVEHAFLGSRAAMKLVQAHQVAKHSVAERMRVEARALVGLRHPNIVRVTDGGMTAEPVPRPFFVMDLLKGDTLRARMRAHGRGLPVRQALDVAIDILDALDHAHRHQMVHRDVKPANIFLTHQGPTGLRAILLDFGVASVIEPGGSGRAGFAGTFEYAAPEQLRGFLSPQSDLYALAMVLYVSLRGRHPFAGEPPERLAQLHCSSEPTPLEALGLGVPPELAELVAAGLHKDPAQRFKDAFSFAQKLRELRARLEGAARGEAGPRKRAEEPPASPEATFECDSTDALLGNLARYTRSTLDTQAPTFEAPKDASEATVTVLREVLAVGARAAEAPSPRHEAPTVTDAPTVRRLERAPPTVPAVPTKIVRGVPAAAVAVEVSADEAAGEVTACPSERAESVLAPSPSPRQWPTQASTEPPTEPAAIARWRPTLVSAEAAGAPTMSTPTEAPPGAPPPIPPIPPSPRRREPPSPAGPIVEHTRALERPSPWRGGSPSSAHTRHLPSKPAGGRSTGALPQPSHSATVPRSAPTARTVRALAAPPPVLRAVPNAESSRRGKLGVRWGAGSAWRRWRWTSAFAVCVCVAMCAGVVAWCLHSTPESPPSLAE